MSSHRVETATELPSAIAVSVYTFYVMKLSSYAYEVVGIMHVFHKPQ